MPPAATAVSAYADLCSLLREAETIESLTRLASWDQETIMPPKAAAFRAEQLSMLSRLAHEKLTSPELGDLIEACEADASLKDDPIASANIREVRREYDLATKLPTSLVSEIAQTSSQAMEVWKEARAKSDFSMFQPWLEKTVALAKRKAECYGAPGGGELYDALLNEYEPGVRSADVEAIFGPLRAELTPLIAQIAAATQRPSSAPDDVKLDRAKQISFNRMVAQALGFDIAGGMLAISAHPFSEGLAPGDTRMTTRYADNRFTHALSGTMHETGHSLYEQGLPKMKNFGQPIAKYISLGVHESQSRLWENQVGRSHAFWQWLTPKVKEHFAPAMDSFGVDDYFSCVNIVEPSFIRVEADEATYHLHIMLRFDCERAMIQGDLSVADLPAWWNERIKNDLGLVVPNDAQGCLQDVHWSMGAIGYFATYSLGSMFSAQLWETAHREMPGLEDGISTGDFSPLLAWLRKNIHTLGRQYTAAELTQKLTGEPLSHEPLMRYLKAKLLPLYGLNA